MDISLDAPMSREHAIRRWINPHTGKPDFSRFSEGNLEARTVAAAHLHKVGFYRTITKAAQELRVPYKRLWSRLQGAHPRTENGVSVTGVKAISTAGEVIAPFLILPSVNLPVRWFKNNLDEEATITTSPTGYVTDVLAHELLLMDGCENHFTEEIFFFCHQHNIVLFPLPPHLTHFLQPLDVGVFGIYKYWHQHVLYREIADGAVDFGKVDFLFHFQEIRKRTFKKSTILSAWAKCGLFPHNPSIVLDRLKDPLSSLTEEVAAETLPGYISEGSSSSDDSSESPQSSRRRDNPQTPISRSQFRWDNVDTPPLRIRTIERYSEYIRMRLEVSITSNVAITPSVSHVYNKLQKAHVTLSLNGIAATRELQRFKDKALRRLTLSEGTSLIYKYGPIRVGDARLRVARDEYNRRAAQQEEQRRLLKKDALNEVKFWKKRCDWWSKANRRRHLDSAVFLSQRYALHRQLHLRKKLIPDWEPTVPWPYYYDNEVIIEALKFIVLDEQERQAKKSLLSFEVDGVEIVHEIEGDSDIEPFIVVKGEEDEEEV
ncbi:hypothetical protein MRS44_016863 [Fusarium solani]|uniref:uncharacterized protein n=1 Tax=Fusarium solani TaxID=169388 RepID=UPI0032C40E63|nr:hypothetical protein MRS44_016863 [Fusarium solani]